MLCHDCLECPFLRYFTKAGSIVATEVFVYIEGCCLDDVGLRNVNRRRAITGNHIIALRENDILALFLWADYLN